MIGSFGVNTYTLMFWSIKLNDRPENSVAPGFKNKTRYTPYVSPGSQISHVATNKGNINRQCLIYNVLSIKNIALFVAICEI